MLVDTELTNKVGFKVLLAFVFKVKPEIIEKLGPAQQSATTNQFFLINATKIYVNPWSIHMF